MTTTAIRFERIIGPAGWTVVALDSESTGVMRDLTRLAERYFGDASIMAELSSRVIANRLAMIACGYTIHGAFTRAYRRFWNESPRTTQERGSA